MRSILAIDWIFQFCGYYLIPYIIHTHISRANIIIQINIYSRVLYSSHIIYLLGLYLLCISPSIYVELFPRGPGEKSSLRTRANLFSPLSKSKGEKGRRRNNEIASKVNRQQSRDRFRKLLSRAGKPSWKARSLFKASRGCHRREMPRRQRKSSRIAVVVVTSSACLVVGDQWFLARARAREARVANRIPENVRTIRRRWKSEEKSKGRARPRISEGEERYRESQTRGGEDGRGGWRAWATCERSKVREGRREGGILGRKGDVNGEGWIGACAIPLLSTCQPSEAATTPGLSLFLPLSSSPSFSLSPSHSRARGAALLDNKLYSTSTGTVLRTTGSPSSPSPRWHHR